MRFLTKTLFGRLFLIILGFMLFVIVVIRIVFTLSILDTAGEKLANYSHSIMLFAEEINQQGTTDSKRRFAEQLQLSTGMILQENTNKQFDSIPNRPIFKAWQESLNRRLPHQFSMSYQHEPQQIVWLHHQNPPEFSIGIPSIININTISRFFTMTAVLTIVFSLLSAYIAAYYLNRPLKDLAEKATLIGKNIDTIEIEPSGPEEIRAVALAMNKMRADLVDITVKQKFLLSSISHDLRTPLNRISMVTELLTPDTQGYIDSIFRDIDEMNEGLNRFIELARFNIEETELWQVGDMALFIKEVVAKYANSDSLISVTLNDTPLLRYKPKALKNFLYNVINNGINHGGGNITISSHVTSDQFALIISDQGPGFPLSDTELLNYSNLDNYNKKLNGLGLRILQLITKLLEAELSLRNKPEGGAEVMLTLNVYHA